MKVLDLNLLLYAVNRDSPQHRPAKAWLEQTLSDEEPVGLPGCASECALYLDDIALFMQTNDFRPDLDGDQLIDVYTVGFTTSPTANDVLEKTADVGNGKFFFSNNAEELADAIVSALIAGEIDLTTPFMPPETVEILASDPNITVEEKVPYAGVLHWLIFNLYEGGLKNPEVDDPAVREAVDYAINKQQIVDVALLGHGAVLPR